MTILKLTSVIGLVSVSSSLQGCLFSSRSSKAVPDKPKPTASEGIVVKWSTLVPSTNSTTNSTLTQGVIVPAIIASTADASAPLDVKPVQTPPVSDVVIPASSSIVASSSASKDIAEHAPASVLATPAESAPVDTPTTEGHDASVVEPAHVLPHTST